MFSLFHVQVDEDKEAADPMAPRRLRFYYHAMIALLLTIALLLMAAFLWWIVFL